MTTNYLPNSVIVKVKETASQNDIAGLQAAMGVIKVTEVQLVSGLQIWQLSLENAPQMISAYGNDPRVQYMELDHIITLPDVQTTSRTKKEKLATITPQTTTPNDPDYPLLWGLNNTGQTGGKPDADIDAPEAWNIQTGDPIVVGVIDSGVDYNHPDLAGNIWTNLGEIAGDGIDNDSNGYIDDVRGWDFAFNDNDPMDVDGHGTHVAGTIAATGNNSLGVIGVAWNKAKIMPLRFLDDSGSGATSNAILAIDYATAKRVKVTNNSWGGLLPIPNKALEDAIKAAGEQGSLFVAAAGNESRNTDLVPAYPASYDLPNIISVAATDHNDKLSYFSNYGANTVDLAAPGSEIYSTTPGGNYDTYSGTSMASPHVAAAVALVWAKDPTLTPAQIKNRLLKTTDPITDPIARLIWKLDAGRLNVANALAGSTSNNNSNLGQTQLRIAATLSPAASANSTETAKGETGKDPLTGGPGADTLLLPFAQPSVSAKDSLTDFGSEKIDLVPQGGAAIQAPSVFRHAANSTVPTLEKGVIPVFTEANGALAGKQALEINSDPLRVAKAGWMADIYRGIYDAKQLGI